MQMLLDGLFGVVEQVLGRLARFKHTSLQLFTPDLFAAYMKT